MIYKEQVRLNQAATDDLMARLEAQKAICDLTEKETVQKVQTKRWAREIGKVRRGTYEEEIKNGQFRIWREGN